MAKLEKTKKLPAAEACVRPSEGPTSGMRSRVPPRATIIAKTSPSLRLIYRACSAVQCSAVPCSAVPPTGCSQQIDRSIAAALFRSGHSLWAHTDHSCAIAVDRLSVGCGQSASQSVCCGRLCEHPLLPLWPVSRAVGVRVRLSHCGMDASGTAAQVPMPWQPNCYTAAHRFKLRNSVAALQRLVNQVQHFVLRCNMKRVTIRACRWQVVVAWGGGGGGGG